MSSAPQTAPRQRTYFLHRPWFPPALAAVLVALVYATTFSFQFVYDDTIQIVNNPWLTSGHFIPRFFTQHVWAFANISGVYWRPLFLLWLFLQRAVFGLDPAGWHVVAVLAHAAAAALVYRLILRLTSDGPAAFIAALVFGVHPATIESVAWVSGATDPLLAIFILPAFLFYLDWRETRARRPLLLSLAFFMLALMTKEPGVMLPGFIFLHAVLFADSRSWTQRLRQGLASAVPYLPVAAGYFMLRAVLLHGLAEKPLPLSSCILTVPSMMWFYVRLLVWPAPISPEYPLTVVTTFSAARVLLPLVPVAVATAAVLFWTHSLKRRGNRNAAALRFGAAWAALSIAPVLVLRGLDAADFVHARYLYLACIGFGLFVATCIRMLPDTGARTFGTPARHAAAAVVVIFALASANVAQQAYWTNNVSLFSRGLTVAPDNKVALTGLAVELGKRGEPQKAILLLQEALRLDPYFWRANFSLGYIYFTLGRYREAEPLLDRAVRIRPFDIDPDQYAYLGLTANRLGDAAKAEWAVRKAAERAPRVERYHYALALILEQQGKLSEAAGELRAVLSLNPANPEARQRLERLYK